MAEEQPSELPTATPVSTEEDPDEIIKPQGRNRKLMFILIAAMLGGTIAGVGGTVVISSLLKEKSTSVPASPPVAEVHGSTAPTPDPKQDALIKELTEKNQRLEAQIKQQAALPMHDAPVKSEDPEKSASRPTPSAPRVIYRTVKSNEKPKVSEDCTITEKNDGLGERLKKCIEDFNDSTR